MKIFDGTYVVPLKQMNVRRSEPTLWGGSGHIECPICGTFIDIGTGEHAYYENIYCEPCDTTYSIGYYTEDELKQMKVQ